MRKAAVALLLLLALGAVAAQQRDLHGYDDEEEEYDSTPNSYEYDGHSAWGPDGHHHHKEGPDHGKPPYVEHCDDDEEDCHPEKTHKNKTIIHKEVEVHKGHSQIPHGRPSKIPRPMWKPVPVEVKKEHHEKRNKTHEEPVHDHTHPHDGEYKKIKLPTWKAVPKHEEHEHKKRNKTHEEPIHDHTHPMEGEYRKIKLPVLKAKPVPIEKKPIKKVKWVEEPVHDVSHPHTKIYEVSS